MTYEHAYKPASEVSIGDEVFIWGAWANGYWMQVKNVDFYQSYFPDAIKEIYNEPKNHNPKLFVFDDAKCVHHVSETEPYLTRTVTK